MYGSQINSKIWQTFIEIEKKTIKEMNQEKNRKNLH
jgi:hypothetical protein